LPGLFHFNGRAVKSPNPMRLTQPSAAPATHIGVSDMNNRRPEAQAKLDALKRAAETPHVPPPEPAPEPQPEQPQ